MKTCRLYTPTSVHFHPFTTKQIALSCINREGKPNADMHKKGGGYRCLFLWQVNFKHGTVIYLAGGPNIAMVILYNFFADGKTYAGTLLFSPGMHPLE